MARTIPNSVIKFYSGIKISANNEEQVGFSSRANQSAYFEAHKVTEKTANTTIRRLSGVVKVQIPGTTLKQCNYLSFINPSFDNMVFYCKIVDYEYENNELATVSFTVDRFQTYMFDVSYDEMYIEREHLSQADYLKSVANPYDPTILEFKTVESLPFSPDMEKPYYSLGNSNTYDGVYAGDAICNDYNLPRRVGLLLVFSDISPANLDGTGGPGASAPTHVLAQALKDLIYDGNGDKIENLCWYRLTKGLYDYLSAAYTNIDQFGRGELWETTSLGDIYPGGSNRIVAPVNYIYVDSMGNSSETDTGYETFTNLLGWFTDNSLLDTILGVYAIPTGLMMYSASEYGVPIQVQMPTAASQNVSHKKLDLFPYSFYRLISPAGDVKELKIEDFHDAQTGSAVVRIGLSMDILEKPNLIAAPTNYKASGAAPYQQSANMNVREGLIFSQFPIIPISIDSFRMQLASVTNQTVGNNTQMYDYDLAKRTGGAGNMILGGLANEAGKSLASFGEEMAKWTGSNKFTDFMIGAGQLANSVAGIEAGYRAADTNKVNLENEMRNDARNVMAGKTDGAIYDNLKYTKPAYGANHYIPINGDGTLNYNQNSFVDILILRVSINPTILAQMDRYFADYGYTSGRQGVARVMNWIKGSNVAADIPQWETRDNLQFTYVKTRDCKISGATIPVSNYIEAMFNAGVRIYNGDNMQ